VAEAWWFSYPHLDIHPRIPRDDFAGFIDVASGITPGYPRMLDITLCASCLVDYAAEVSEGVNVVARLNATSDT